MPAKNLSDSALFPGPKPAGEVPDLLRSRVDQRIDAISQAFGQAGFAAHKDSRISPFLPLVVGVSDFVFSALCRDPGLLEELVETGELFLPSFSEDISGRLGLALANIEEEEAFKEALRRFRQREMVRIAWQDLAGIAGLLQTMGELCALADAVLERTVSGMLDRR